MRKNANLVLCGQGAILVPYKKQDPVLQESTASDPLTLKEEYRMQKAWAEDEDKCTFIVLDPDLSETPATQGRGGGMAGDVNLFLNDPEDRHLAEIEVMIAEPLSRGKGLAYEALVLLMLYAVTHLDLNKFVAKIGYSNTASQSLFQKLGYREHSRSSVFQEITFVLQISEATKLLRCLCPVDLPASLFPNTRHCARIAQGILFPYSSWLFDEVLD